MKYSITVEFLDLLLRRGEWKRIGRANAECDLGQVARSMDLAVRDAEDRLGVSSGEAEILRKLKDLLS